ncbi:MAG TPA: thiamine pyrophosphate-binding protein [Nitrospinota bacterium]|jgi:acetolactate synthase-1/2/3 large subunit/sulfoacetaldehyde acetyltransferase|nr:thiamine pyrophosphate-binding protein [Nitrospinota bacterium]MDP7502807.1 thiamine pyrophosphate-binding protein [Nitrospinota bacterium]MDP7663614.1 thiamine pyrophosphate-binding protein [Nitrospinota bacterium]HJP12850.1 thiamine pyrophosphate-binding protein [Nitrospinota bacterium]
MAKMSAGYAVAESLAQLGVRNVIGMAGSCLVEILDGMYGREDLGFVTVRHEQSGALMASAHGRLTGSPGVCMATNGPGATNLITGVAHAKLAQSPVVVITGAPMTKDMFYESTQEIDHLAMFAPVVKRTIQVRKAGQTANLVREAYHTAISGVPGPVHLDIPRDIMLEDVDVPRLNSRGSDDLPRAGADPARLAEAAELLKKAARPLILAGGGVIWAEATDDLIALAEALGAPIMTSTGRDDVVPTAHPLFLGSIGRGTIPEAGALFKEADVVLAVGTRLAHSTTFLRDTFLGEGTKLIHAAHDQKSVERHYPAEVGLIGDSGLVLQGLLALTGDNSSAAEGSGSDWKRRADEVMAAQSAHREKGLTYGAKPIDPRRAQMALAKVIPQNAIITLDAGSAAGYVYEYHQFDRPRSFLAPQDLAAIGIGYPLGLGAKLACPDRPVVTISGDGAFLFNGAELETAVREKLNTVTIILNNHNLGSERAYQNHFYNERYIGDAIGNPRFDDYARAFGAVGYRVEDPSELEDVYSEALKQNKPVLVDVIIDADIYPEPRRKDAVKQRG